MNKQMLLFLCLSLTSAVYGKDKVIVNPACDFNESSICTVTRIEIGKKETRVFVDMQFFPGGWIRFGADTYLEDCVTDERWRALDMKNAALGQEIYFPASGDTSVVFIFPALGKAVKKVNLCDNDEKGKAIIYGLSLNPKETRKPHEIPPAISSWLNEEIAASKRKTLMNIEDNEFFASDTARLIGYIKGYDPRAAFSTGIIYIGNDITREDSPIAIQIHEDGRFEGNIPMNYPVCQKVFFDDRGIDFYLEPGQTLAMILDWDEYRKAKTHNNYKFQDVRFLGAAAEINREFTSFLVQLPDYPSRKIYEERSKKNPDEFKVFFDETIADYAAAYRRLLDTETLSERTKTLLKNHYKVWYAAGLLDYEMDYGYNNNKEKIPDSWYDFLQDIPMNNHALLSSYDFGLFINRLEYCSPLSEADLLVYRSMSPAKTLFQYMFEELGKVKTAEDEEYISMDDSLYIKIFQPDMTKEQQKELHEEHDNAYQKFLDRHQAQKDVEEYNKKYVEIKHLTQEEIETEGWRLKDSLYINKLKLKPGIIYDVTKVRSMDYRFKEMFKDEKESAWNHLTALAAGIEDSFLKKEADRLFLKNFPEGGKKAYELPETPEAKIFKDIIEPFKGKFLLVDFWATSCGPCVYNIKEHKSMREKYKNSPDVDFVYITDDSGSPYNTYIKFVEEQELTNTYRLTADQYRYLRQLFRFNGIPRYVLVDREGLIVDDNAPGYNFEHELNMILKK
ncbi:MAG: TlpA family protein disulfide reductase [Tannerella sp.]|jgi:thiol-disulfide isomerase/thioredoxin|nr:TlpA family protein disulfide reductase [Tannerella sp.]